ncbi:hypothetical protein [Sphingomonas prati]|uniref:DUF3883 domain-containing protein n=1 Tax=Sphingomonas prati TaxID=1843237 RepID=A0A7W9F4J9_9SPHN|nr:hypothetical protein [Sphingomonas prati]MBB5730999.1 hypothetical protein [Sphingomonas prati]GGE98448.1 hypothetical protein GCM10011404_34520 [Sphingomonas prati]
MSRKAGTSLSAKTPSAVTVSRGSIDVTVEADGTEAAPSSFLGHRTAKAAIAILLAKGQGFHEPTRKERDALRIGYAMRGKVLYGAAYDMVRMTRTIDLTDAQTIASSIEAIEIIEVKSTNRVSMKPDLKGYFFNITAGELLVAQSLGAAFRFAFVNTLTSEHEELSLNQVLGRARGLYPAWHIRF